MYKSYMYSWCATILKNQPISSEIDKIVFLFITCWVHIFCHYFLSIYLFSCFTSHYFRWLASCWIFYSSRNKCASAKIEMKIFNRIRRKIKCILSNQRNRIRGKCVRFTEFYSTEFLINVQRILSSNNLRYWTTKFDWKPICWN